MTMMNPSEASIRQVERLPAAGGPSRWAAAGGLGAADETGGLK